MTSLNTLSPERVFYYFNEICKIPHGSRNCSGIAAFCENFAIEHNLKYFRDNANNVIIYKNASPGYENADTIILQGHIDMVCQCISGTSVDYINTPVKPYVDGDFIKAQDTTLGADNGIAVAMILAILESDRYAHPPLEAVFTTDEEIGMIGALQLDMGLLNGKKMINMDSEEDDTLTVSCAGGRDFTVCLKKETELVNGTRLSIILKGLQGGHSGVEIDKGRVNADILAGRVLNHISQKFRFEIISINGGTKSNAIANQCEIELCTSDVICLSNYLNNYLNLIKSELSSREGDFNFEINLGDSGEFEAFKDELRKNLIFALVCSPQGVIDMSKEIDSLVETSLNLGVLSTNENDVFLQYSFRSNKKSAIDRLEEQMRALYTFIPCQISVFGDYPSWDFNPNSDLQKLYKNCYSEVFRKELKVSAIHAGLECGVFDSAITGLDCISIGPDMFDVHTVNERLSISSTSKMFKVVLKLLEKSNNS